MNDDCMNTQQKDEGSFIINVNRIERDLVLDHREYVMKQQENSLYKTLYEAMKQEIEAGISAHDNAIRVTDEHEKPRTLSGLVTSRNTLVELRNVMQCKEEQAGIECEYWFDVYMKRDTPQPGDPMPGKTS